LWNQLLNRMDELGHVLMTLSESCEYESSAAKQSWENALGVKINHTTRLLITDGGFLPEENAIAPSEGHHGAYARKIYKILRYYVGDVV
jgi:hypothetical protein